MLSVFALVMVVLAICVVWRRARPGLEASKTAKHPVLEGAAALALFGMALFLVVDTAAANSADQSAGRALEVKATAFQWCWRFNYVTAGFTRSGTCIGHRDLPLVIPVGQPVQLEVSSDDVVHELWIQ